MIDDIWQIIYDIWWYVMIYDLWSMTIYDDLWRSMMIYDDLWWSMMIFDTWWLYDMIWYDMIWYDRVCIRINKLNPYCHRGHVLGNFATANWFRQKRSTSKTWPRSSKNSTHQAMLHGFYFVSTIRGTFLLWWAPPAQFQNWSGFSFRFCTPEIHMLVLAHMCLLWV